MTEDERAGTSATEREFDGDEIARILARDPSGIAAALIGCAVYRVDPDRLDTTAGIDAARRTPAVSTPRGTRQVALAGAYVLSDDGRLAAALEG